MLQIGSLSLDLPVIQAALSGYSDWPMRAIARRLGAPYTVAEVMIDSFVNSLRDRKRTSHFLMVNDDDHPAGAQLMGADPDGFPAAAERLVTAGFDVIDIGVNNDVEAYIEAALKHNADIVGMSALLTTTMGYMKVVIDTFQQRGIRNDYAILVGGAPLNEDFAREIGADY